jgi:aerobic-type carbon monoxide dehydrogenase small subunit (CoxS/CutS family)
MSAPMSFPEPRPTLTVRMTVNGPPAEHEVEARTLLVHHLRENLRLTGTGL